MSELLKRLADCIRTLPDVNVRVAVDGLSEDVRPMLSDSEPNEAGRDLEGRSIEAVPVGDPSPGRFCYFMDGMQRPRGPIYIGTNVPIMYGYVAAAIRMRGSDKRMRTLSGAHQADEALYFSYDLLDKNPEGERLRTLLAAAGLRTVDIRNDRKPVIEHPLAQVQAARDKISTVRGNTESELVARWLADSSFGDGWLLVDGSLRDDQGKHPSANILGVTKSHGTQYFAWDEQQKILDLKVGQRSGIFIPVIGGRWRPVYSWYLRLRPNDGQDVYFGLVRVEAPKSERILEMADEVSRWLLAERCPLSLPDARWDKMIYPIRDCEQYLKSIAPSHLSLDAMMITLVNAAGSGGASAG